MERVKFRAWNGMEMLYDNFLVFPNGEVRFAEKSGEGFYISNFKRAFLSQWTGLTDKNGKEIYEGDVLRTTDVPELPAKVRVATYLAPSFYLQKRLSDTVDVDTFSTPTIDEEVIGNIYENPELLAITH